MALQTRCLRALHPHDLPGHPERPDARQRHRLPADPVAQPGATADHRSRGGGDGRHRQVRRLVPHPDIERFLAAAEATADVAGAVIRPLFRAGLDADLKGDQSPVTIADRTAEQAMRAVLSERLPDHGILGEEFGLDRPDARLRWVLDPIDGTRALITGRPIFGTLVSLLDGDTPLLGVVDQPVTGERWVGVAGR